MNMGGRAMARDRHDMGLRAWLSERRDERQYRTARTLLLAHYTYSRLDPARQAAVTDLCESYLQTIGAPLAFGRKFASWWRWAMFRAIAMRDLGIAPALTGENWQVPKSVTLKGVRLSYLGFPWPQWSLTWFLINTVRDFRRLDPPYARAKADLCARGLDIEGTLPDSLDEVHHFHGTTGVTWREWWRSGGMR